MATTLVLPLCLSLFSLRFCFGGRHCVVDSCEEDGFRLTVCGCTGVARVTRLEAGGAKQRILGTSTGVKGSAFGGVWGEAGDFPFVASMFVLKVNKF